MWKPRSVDQVTKILVLLLKSIKTKRPHWTYGQKTWGTETSQMAKKTWGKVANLLVIKELKIEDSMKKYYIPIMKS
jgi:hypothetical protein